MTEQLVTAYTRYKVQKAKIKARQRQELEKELEPWARDVGEAILAEKVNGLKVDEIAILIGNKNRNFQYDMMRTATNGLLVDNGIDPVTTKPLVESEPDELQFTIRSNAADKWQVDTWRNDSDVEPESYVLETYKGKVQDLPESWLTATPADRNVYRMIIAEVEGE